MCHLKLLLGIIIFQKIRRHLREAHKIIYTLGTDQIRTKLLQCINLTWRGP